MLNLSSSKGIRIDVSVLSVSRSVEDHSVIIQALRKELIEREASDTGGVPRWKSTCPDRLAEATILRKGLIEREASDTGGVPRWKSSCPDRLAEATITYRARGQ